jgi:DNA-binding HxlR family transcriptional regulator
MSAILGGDIRCPIARSLDVVGDRWSLMIVRDALAGATRFSQFQQSLGVPRDVLTARLATLVDGGVFTRESYREPGERARDHYLLTEAGHELVVVLRALGGWAAKNRPIDESPLIEFVETSSGEPVGIALTAGGQEVSPAGVSVSYR